MTPGKIFLLLIRAAVLEIDMLPLGLTFPALVITDLGIIPHVIIAVIRVVNPVGAALGATGDERRRDKGRCQKESAKNSFWIMHVVPPYASI